jgi:hypothetical protein
MIYRDTNQVQSRIDELVGKIDSEIGGSVIESLGGGDADCEDIVFLQQLVMEVEENVEGRYYEDSEVEELIDLLEFKNSFWKYNTGWVRGEPLIEWSTTETYFEEMCRDVGYISKDLPDFIVINWEQTAQNMLRDYADCVIGDYTYYFLVN